MHNNASIAALLAAATPAKLIEEVEVTINGVTQKVNVKHLNFIETDMLRVAGFGNTGTFDAQKFAGNNARWVALGVVDEFGQPVDTYENICLWPPVMVDELSTAVDKVNKLTPSTQAAAAGNSVATVVADSSSSSPSTTSTALPENSSADSVTPT